MKMRRKCQGLVVHSYNPKYSGESQVETSLMQHGYIKKCPTEKGIME
jgi:hypothetical protein